MNTFAKLNLNEQNDIEIVNAPESFEREIFVSFVVKK